MDTTERLHFHFSLSCIAEGNDNPLQCSCLENLRDGGDWWAAVYGIAQSRTRLKWLSSSSLYYFLKCQNHNTKFYVAIYANSLFTRMCYLKEVIKMISNIKWLVTLFFVLISDVIESPVPNILKTMKLSFLKLLYSIKDILETREQIVTKTCRPLTAFSNFSH